MLTPPSLPPPAEINVLLLGETSVGKSTFINAFLNYLIFETLQEAERSEQVVLIPVSFPISVGNDFQEVTVKLGDVNPNENHQNQGQSVTQCCRSYIFDLNQQLRLRLIDTPGIGDTRGYEQDQISMNHVFTYINQLSHLNAVCLLLKPTVTKSDVFFRSCVQQQLITYLTPDGCQNIVFCFINSRSAHYGPGSTASILKGILKDEQLQSIPFEKKNTFFFDDEAFRYLAARKCNVPLEDFVQQESVASWTKSVTESVRLIEYIRGLRRYDFNQNKSLKNVALHVSTLARPLMETLRLKVFNWKLAQSDCDQKVIIQTDKVDVEICSYCAESSVIKVGSIDIVQYGPTRRKNVTTCHCPHDEKHFLIEYTIKHNISSQQQNLTSQQLQNSATEFLHKCGRLIHFLQQNGLTNTNDPFSSVLERFISEDKQIREASYGFSDIHKAIHEIIRRLPQKHKNNCQRIDQLPEKLSLNNAYQLIDELTLESETKQQIECIKRSRRLLMNKAENKVEIPATTSKHFAALTKNDF